MSNAEFSNELKIWNKILKLFYEIILTPFSNERNEGKYIHIP